MKHEMDIAIMEFVSRLLKLQGNVSTAQVKRRAIEHFGERSHVLGTVTKVLARLVALNVIKRVERGLYEPGVPLEMDQDTWSGILALLEEKSGNAIAIESIQNMPLGVFFKLPEIPFEKQFRLGDNRMYFEIEKKENRWEVR
jgi:hypothetical protein